MGCSDDIGDNFPKSLNCSREIQGKNILCRVDFWRERTDKITGQKQFIFRL